MGKTEIIIFNEQMKIRSKTKLQVDVAELLKSNCSDLKPYFSQSNFMSQARDVSKDLTTELRLRESLGLNFCVWDICIAISLPVVLKVS